MDTEPLGGTPATNITSYVSYISATTKLYGLANFSIIEV